MNPDHFSSDIQYCRGLWGPTAIIVEDDMRTIRRSDSPQDRTDRMSHELIAALSTVLAQWREQQVKHGAGGVEVAAAIVRAMAVMSASAYRACGYCRSLRTLALARALLRMQGQYCMRYTKNEGEKGNA